MAARSTRPRRTLRAVPAARPATSRARSWRARERWDVLVVGGGVHGAAIARDAATRGLSVLLVEKNDFACGTSSRSSKLAHGGLRYLEHLEVGLVRESLRERDALLRAAPHLAWPLPFLIPLSGPRPRAGWKVRIGLSLYDLLAGRRSLGHHEIITSDEALAMAPGLAGSGIERAARYFDAGMDDARIVVELVIDAVRSGATCLNHVRAERLVRERGRVVGARLREADGRTTDVRAAVTVLANGPWLDALAARRETGDKRLALTKGVHLFVRRDLVRSAALMLAVPQDDRIFFVIPWKGGTLVGTTDTAFRQPADRVRASSADVRYLLKAVNASLPQARVKPSEIVAVQAGLRPLIAAKRSGAPSSISRDYKLDRATLGLVVVEGGKYTIFRKLAERVVDAVSEDLRDEDPARSIRPCVTEERRLPGAALHWDGFREIEEDSIAKRVGRDQAERLVRRYGARTREVLDAAGRDDSLLEPACDEHPHLLVEAVNAVRNELASTPADALLRRLDLGWWACGGLRCRDRWATAFRAAGLKKSAITAGFAAHEAELAHDWRL